MGKKIKKNQKGFTLVELVVVIAILAVLVTLLVPTIMGNVEDARIQREASNARTIASQVTVYNAMHIEGERIVATGTGDVLQETDYTAKLSLPAGSHWPASDVANLKIDTDGNAYVEILKGQDKGEGEEGKGEEGK